MKKAPKRDGQVCGYYIEAEAAFPEQDTVISCRQIDLFRALAGGLTRLAERS